MADIGGAASELFKGVGSTAGWVVVAIVGVLLGFGLFWYFFVYKRQFDIFVKIISTRAEDPAVSFDKGAILSDRKTKTKYFKLWDKKVELPVPPFKLMVNTNKGDYIELLRKSEDEFVYLTNPQIDKKYLVRANGKLYPIANTIQRHLESDVHWYLKRKEEDKALLDPEGLLAKLLHHLPILVSGFFMMIILWIFMTKLPGILAELRTLAEVVGQGSQAVISTGG